MIRRSISSSASPSSPEQSATAKLTGGDLPRIGPESLSIDAAVYQLVGTGADKAAGTTEAHGAVVNLKSTSKAVAVAGGAF